MSSNAFPSAGAASDPIDAGDRGTVLSRNAIYDMVWAQPMQAAAAELGLSGNGLAKICDRLLIPYPTRGYWAKVYAGQDMERTPLPSAPATMATEVSIKPSRAGSRRPRSRLSREDRRVQISDAASRLIRDEGVYSVTLKRVAREIGVSETQIYNYFGSVGELLVDIARAELTEMSKARMAAVRIGTDPQMRYTLTTLAYLRQVTKRGVVLQQLLALPEVRRALRDQHEQRRTANRKVFSDVFDDAYGVPRPVSSLIGAIVTTLSLRAGKLIATGKIDLETAERFVMPAVGVGIAYMKSSAAPKSPER